jgi:membrane protease YdiL (CAAX protease family)
VTTGVCETCGVPYKAQAQFCAACGQPRAREPSQLGFVIKFFVALLGVMMPALIYVVHLDGDPFVAELVASAGLFVVIAGFAIAGRRMWWPLYRRPGFGPLGYGALVVAAPVVIALVLGYVLALSHAFDLHSPDELAPLRAHGWAWMIALVVVFPPLSEELAFRGIIYTGLTRTFGLWESVLISSFAFALLHLSIPALVTHLPLGVYLCLLRQRSQSIWPSTFAHALHNLGVILVGQLGLI